MANEEEIDQSRVLDDALDACVAVVGVSDAPDDLVHHARVGFDLVLERVLDISMKVVEVRLEERNCLRSCCSS